MTPYHSSVHLSLIPPAVGLGSGSDFGAGGLLGAGPDLEAGPGFVVELDFAAGADLDAGAGLEGSFIERLMRFFARSTAMMVTMTF